MNAEQQGRRIVRAARSELTTAERRLAEIAANPGEATAADLVEAEASIRLAGMRVEAAVREAERLVLAERQVAVDAYERRARRTKAAELQTSLASQLRAIKSGRAAELAHDLRSGGGVKFPTTVEAFMELHPTFDPNATHHYEPTEGAA